MANETQLKTEWVSALMDGALRGDEFAQAVVHIEQSDQARQAWASYHLVGDVLRAGPSAATSVALSESALVERWRAAVALNASEIVAKSQDNTRVKGKKESQFVAANDGHWRRVVGLASVAFVGVLVWQSAQWLGTGGPVTGAPTLAQSPVQPQPAVANAVALADGTGAVMLRDPQLDALLAAHRQNGGVSALQASAGFLRNATFQEAPR